MLEWLAEFLVEVLVRWVLAYPGALIWWFFTGRKESIQAIVMKQDWWQLSTIAVLAFVVVFATLDRIFA
ncbi:MAG: hypothetical protein IPM12_13630 [Flavobacteriales bacterium]|nr:hypothetical protein [Flavobacteriales bacterium]